MQTKKKEQAKVNILITTHRETSPDDTYQNEQKQDDKVDHFIRLLLHINKNNSLLIYRIKIVLSK